MGLFGPCAGEVHYLKGEALVLGRNVECDISIPSLEVSRHHCKVWRDDHDAWFVEDLGSSNGTYINGMKTKAAQEIQFGDRLQLARDSLMVFTHHDTLEDQVLQLQKMDALGQLAGEVAHDFKNLLTVFSATVDMWRLRRSRGQLRTDGAFTDEKLDQSLDRMEEASSRASELIQRLLGYARPSSGEAEPVDVVQIVLEALRLCAETIPQEITVEQKLPDACRVPGDAGQLHQAVMNLLINARDAMPDGGTLQVTVEELEQSHVEGLDAPLSPRGFVCISVADTGVGMDSATRERIFDPFFTTKGEGKGTGLGLATVNSIAARHDGQVLVETQLGVGSTFHLLMPTWRPEHGNRTEVPLASGHIPSIAYKDTLVLSAQDRVIATTVRQWEDDVTMPSREPEEE